MVPIHTFVWSHQGKVHRNPFPHLANAQQMHDAITALLLAAGGGRIPPGYSRPQLEEGKLYGVTDNGDGTWSVTPESNVDSIRDDWVAQADRAAIPMEATLARWTSGPNAGQLMLTEAQRAEIASANVTAKMQAFTAQLTADEVAELRTSGVPAGYLPEEA